MFVEYQRAMPSMRAFRPGRNDRLHQGLAGLEILGAAHGQSILVRQSIIAGISTSGGGFHCERIPDFKAA